MTERFSKTPLSANGTIVNEKTSQADNLWLVFQVLRKFHYKGISYRFQFEIRLLAAKKFIPSRFLSTYGSCCSCYNNDYDTKQKY